MTFYQDLSKSYEDARKQLLEHERLCLGFVATTLIDLRTNLGWPEQQFQRIDIGDTCPDNGTRAPFGYMSKDGLHFAFRISLANWFVQFHWTVKRTTDGGFALNEGKPETAFTLNTGGGPEALAPVVQYLCEALREEVHQVTYT